MKIARLMREAGNEPPVVALRQGAVIVKFGLPGKTPGKPPGKPPGKTPDQILRLLTESPDLSIPQLAALMSKSERAIERAISALRKSDRLERIGPAKGGHWKVKA